MTRLPRRAAVVIIGGGVMGASVAFHLAESGVEDVLLLEAGSFAGGSTSRSAGGVRAQFSDPTNLALAERSLRAFEGFGRRPGASIDLHQVGYLFLHTDPDAWLTAQDAVTRQNAQGIDSRILSIEEAAAKSPAFSMSGVMGATFHARDGYCSPEAVVMGYIAGARRHGATAVTGVRVREIEVCGGEVSAVHTTEGSVATGAVICCAGAWSASVGQMAGVDLPVEPVRRQILVSEPLAADLGERLPVTMPMTIDAATTLYAHREGPGLLMGMSYADETPGFHEGVSDDWLPALTSAMELRAPALLDLGIAHRWAGYYERTPDDNALVGESRQVSRFLYATGFSGHGFLMGPAVGEVVCDLWHGRTPAIAIDAMDIERFAQGRLVRELGIV